MQLVKDVVIPFFYNYYQMFFYGMCIIITIAVCVKLLWQNIFKYSAKICLAVLTFILAFGVTRYINDINIFRDKLIISAEDVEKGSVVLDSVSFGIYEESMKETLSEKSRAVDIPIGFQREIDIYSSVDTKLFLKAADYQDSYIIKAEDSVQSIPIYTDSKKIYISGEILLKTIMVIMVTLGVMILLGALAIYGRRIKWIKMRKEDSIIFLYFIACLFFFQPGKINNWVAGMYALNYQDGFSSRLLVGSTLNALFGMPVLQKDAVKFVLCVLIIICMLTAVLLGKLIRENTGKIHEAVLFFCVMYMVSPMSIAYLWDDGEMGRMETYVLLFMLIGVLGFERLKNIYAKYIFLMVMSVLMILAYQGGVFLYYQIIFCVMIYDVLSETEVKKIALMLTNLAITAIGFIYMQIYARLNYTSAEETIKVLSERTDLPINEATIKLEYFASLLENWEYGQKYFLQHYHVSEKVLLACIMAFPLIVFLLGMLTDIWKNNKITIKNWYKNPVTYILLSNVMYIPIYILMCDWGRWTGAFIGVIFFEIGYCLYKKNEGTMLTFIKLQTFIEDNKLICLVVIGLVACLDKNSGVFNRMIDRVFEFLFQMSSIS